MSHEPPDPFADDMRRQLAYAQEKATSLAAKLDDARREIERLTAERDALGRDKADLRRLRSIGWGGEPWQSTAHEESSNRTSRDLA